MGIQNSEGLKTLGYIKNATFLHSKNDHKQKNAKTNDSSYHAHDSNSVIQRGDLKKKTAKHSLRWDSAQRKCTHLLLWWANLQLHLFKRNGH